TEYKQAERLLRRREADLAEAQRIALLGSWSYDVRTQSVNWSEELYRVFDVEEGKFDGLYESFLNSVHPEDKAKVLETNRRAIKSGEPFEVEYRILARNNQLKHIREVGYARKDNTGRISGLFGTAQDITDRKRDEEELQKFASILRRSSEVINLMTLDGKMIFLNETGCRMLGIDPDRVEEFNIRDVIPEPLGPMLKTELLPTLLMSGTWEGELQYKNIKTGDLVDVYAMTFTIADPVSKSPLYLANISRDISERKQAEAERIKLQEQLLQSQKLEAVGVLAGGVAHDFNNILGAIIGYAEITMDAMTPDDPLRQNLGKILDAAMRSTNIVRQLLAFARKQVIAPVLLDLNESVEATLKMIRRLIGENIELAWLPGTGPRKVLMDPSQLDQVLLNLCVNARDAIGGVGKVTIQTETVLFDETYCLSHTDVMAGKYVQLSVSDNGCGMDKETQKHIFDPFFTTKGPGKGTGMGLATVYGIVRQNSGFVNAHSELGKGTTFKIYIPLHDVASPEVKKTAAFDLPRSRGETILVAEDDPTMLQMSKLMLQKLGYSVLSADKPSEALRLTRDNSVEIHLFITDIVMPEMNGRDLAQQILAVRPKIKCLFMSGYTADVIAHQCVLEDGVHFIQKPFLLKELASKVREVLG
ncbi:MAG TPA: ATP-binding protein, partial [Smithellaceae bacterium]|nr:ATP-binding protein [Smithellaceae bacterium]